jgi:hypothetical protein
MSREYHYTWTYDLEASAEALWPLVSDTNRFNRDTGLPAVKLLGIQNRVRRVKYDIPLIPVEWDEEPFEWTYPYRFGILRRYHRGPLVEMRVDCKLERREPSGTRIVYDVWARPNGVLGDLAISLGIGFASARRFERVFREYDSIAIRGGVLKKMANRQRIFQRGRTGSRSVVNVYGNREWMNRSSGICSSS